MHRTLAVSIMIQIVCSTSLHASTWHKDYCTISHQAEAKNNLDAHHGDRKQPVEAFNVDAKKELDDHLKKLQDQAIKAVEASASYYRNERLAKELSKRKCEYGSP
jgi:hypothetical protein